MRESLREMMKGLYDYAGLFPPASLDMGPTCSTFTRHLMGEHRELVSHIVVPAWRLEEFSENAAAMMPGTFATSGYTEHANASDPWRISAILKPDDPASGLDAIEAFNERHQTPEQGQARVDTVEVRAPSTAFIDEANEALPDDLFVFFEVDHEGDPRGMLAAIAGTGGAAKIRTGSVRADEIPSVEKVGAFIQACTTGEVPFKCTAGLHHPVRLDHPLTYEDSPPVGTMHGFFNVIMASGLAAFDESPLEETIEILEDRSPDSFTFDDGLARWRDRALNTDQIAQTRSRVMLGIGSCNIDEPIEDLTKLGLI